MRTMPDCVIGDFDSTINTTDLIAFISHYRLRRSDFTDTEAAINHAIELGIRDITVYGGIGGRLDHTFGNGLFEKYLGKLDHPEFMDEKFYAAAWMVNHVVQRFSIQFLTTDSFACIIRFSR